jgi:hypothetical protein
MFVPMLIWRVAGGCMVFRDLLFVSNTLYGSKIDEMREFLHKNNLLSFLYGF